MFWPQLGGPTTAIQGTREGESSGRSANLRTQVQAGRGRRRIFRLSLQMEGPQFYVSEGEVDRGVGALA